MANNLVLHSIYLHRFKFKTGQATNKHLVLDSSVHHHVCVYAYHINPALQKISTTTSFKCRTDASTSINKEGYMLATFVSICRMYKNYNNRVQHRSQYYRAK